MEPLLLLVHRIPFPPNKGDKIRSYHLLKFLATCYQVHLGTFVDEVEDLAYVPELSGLCATHTAIPLDPRSARLRSVSGFITGEALTLPYYRSSALRRWVERSVEVHGIRKAIAFSSAMAQYVLDMKLRVVVDFVDVDSLKWTQYSQRRNWPSSFVYRREGRKLLSFERAAAAGGVASVFVTRSEAALFAQSVPEFRSRIVVIENGVDTEYFSPRLECTSPFAEDELALVFTGAMDYWPNTDAVTWFAREVLPLIRRHRPSVRFYIVGMKPSATVRALATEPGVVVTGAVPDVRPYLQHASVVVAPLRVARGVQNKILEAMAMGRPVVASTAAGQGVSAQVGLDFEQAADPQEFASKVVRLLDPAVALETGRRARERVRAAYNWNRNMAGFRELLESDVPLATAAG